MSTFRTAILAVMVLLGVEASHAAIQHDNDFYFVWQGGGSPSLSYSSQGHEITSGQPWGGVSSSQSGNTLHILIKAGRKGSGSVASSFNGTLYDGAIAITSGNNTPEELNFYTYGVLRINGDSYEVSIGQGHDYATGNNNWWVGGHTLTGFRPRSMVATTDGKYTITTGSDVFHFNIYPNTVAPNWMQAHIHDTMTLAQYSIPGTHDSGTYAMDSGSAVNTFAVTQDYSILTQLNMGIRVLDIRLGQDSAGDPLMIYHNMYQTKLSFSFAMKQALDFLTVNQGETVIMFIKHEHGSTNITDGFVAALRAYDATLNKYWLADRMPQTGQVRGKIVFVNRNGDIGSYGINVNWQDNCTFTSNLAVIFRIQDQYQYTGSADKIRAFDSLLDEVPDNPQAWFVNYLSATEVPIYGVKDIASQVNPAAYRELATTYASAKTVGTIMMDYAGEINTPDIIANILRRNQLSTDLSSSSGSPNCFIATAAFGSYLDPRVQILRDFRDTFLFTNHVGQSFVNWYYTMSPPIADFIRARENLKAIARIALLPVVGIAFLCLGVGILPMLLLLLLCAVAVFVAMKRVCRFKDLFHGRSPR